MSWVYEAAAAIRDFMELGGDVLWAIMAAPLLVGTDLREMTTATLETLTNPEVIAVDQDPAGIQGVKVRDNGAGLEVWARPLRMYGARAVVLLNRTDEAADISVEWDDIGLAPGSARAWLTKGMLHYELKQYADAKAALERNLALAPNGGNAETVRLLVEDL